MAVGWTLKTKPQVSDGSTDIDNVYQCLEAWANTGSFQLIICLEGLKFFPIFLRELLRRIFVIENFNDSCSRINEDVV